MQIPNSLNIPQVLSYGVIGLGFLLALLAYYLLHKEHGRQRPNKSILKSVYVFMAFSIVLVIAGLSAELLKHAEVIQLSELKQQADSCLKDASVLRDQLSSCDGVRKKLAQDVEDKNTEITRLNDAVNKSGNPTLINAKDKDREILRLQNELRDKDSLLRQYGQDLARLDTSSSQLSRVLDQKAGAVARLREGDCSENRVRELANSLSTIDRILKEAIDDMRSRTQRGR
jgi:chromosome segregation ATPase